MEEMVAAGPAAAPAAGGAITRGSETELILTEVLAGVLHVEHVSADSHFFEDLGADSLTMAHFCARVRKRGGLPSISIRDVYEHPTITALAAAVAGAERPARSAPSSPPAEAPAAAATSRQYLVCGALQLAAFLAYCYLAALGAAWGYGWIAAGSGALDVYLRAVAASTAGFVLVCAVPIAAKWLLIGRWRPRQIQLWSLAYVRFWIVKTLVRSNPCALLFVGSPLYSLYLRALGAKVGPGAVIFSRRVPVCTDLLTVGAGTVIRRESLFQCYRAQAGWIETGPVSLGSNVLIGEKAVLDIGTSMGAGAQLGHTSALLSGQSVPAGERWHGSPAERADVDYVRVPPAACGRLRRASFCLTTLLALALVYLPLIGAGLDLLVPGRQSAAGLLLDAVLVSLGLFFGATVIGLLVVMTVPRLLNRLLEPDVAYPLYGMHDRVHRAIVRLTSFKLFTFLFGDSSYVVGYLRGLGYDLSEVEQTGSNFGIEVRQANPFLSCVGTGTMVADGLVMINDDVSSTSFKVSRASVGPHNFVGNDVMYPAGGRTGENCLLATKVMVPLDGTVRSGVGLLGSPPFEIPRSVERDSRFDHLRTGEALRRGLAAKNRYNLRTIGMFLFARWLGVFVVTALDLSAFQLDGELLHALMAVLFALSLVASGLYSALVERCVGRFRALAPTYCSIYDPAFWLHERLWKVPATEYLRVFDGTPYKNIIWRLMGVRIGRRVFDDGVHISERTLTSIGDDAVLNARSKIQCHSQEDGTFKSDATTIGARCTVGVGALVHYGVTMGDGAMLAADSFLMKGEEVPPRARWAGNPAREM